MFDSTTAADIPADAEIVAGYIDGTYAWSAQDWARFPNAPHVTISCLGTDGALVLDVEAGCCSPWDAPGWIRRRSIDLPRPCLYVNRSNWAMTAGLCTGLDYDVWLADYNGVPHLTPGTVATQYANPAYGSGGHYDKSLVADGWPAGGSDVTPEEHQLLVNASNTGSANHNMLRDGVNPGEASYLAAVILPAIQAVQAPGGFTAADRTALNNLTAAVAALTTQVATLKLKADKYPG